ncbi:MAG: DUF3365 domain-containing protein [Saprospiraceae bacterium]
MKILFTFSVLALLTFFACNNAVTPLSEDQKAAYMRDGKNITLMTFSSLSARLGKAMKEQGVQGAVKYCNVAALPLTDSLAQLQNVTIKRTSLQLRNPKNAPTEDEKNMLFAYQAQEKAGSDLVPVVQQVDNGVIKFFAPIRMMDVCQKCHGSIGETMQEEDYAYIKSLYPEDQATGFKEGDLRGMWSITFQR